MAEDLVILKKASKEKKYQSIILQINALVATEEDLIANLANISAALKEQFNWLWVGFYLAKGDELVLGPFQGPVACTRIKKGKGVCGTAWLNEETIIVPNVEEFPGHIACSSISKSEIVLPFYHRGKLAGVLDVDSEHWSHFDEMDAHYLHQIIRLMNG